MSVPTLDANRFRREMLLVCNVSADVPTFFASVRMVFDRNVESDSSSWFTFDPATNLPTGLHDFRAIPPEDQARFLEHEATADDIGRFVTIARDRPYVSLLPDPKGAAGFEASTRYQEFLKPNGWEYELRIAFVRDGLCWGGVSLYRNETGPPFNNPEFKAVSGVVEFLGEAMQRSLIASVLAREEDGARAPGVVVLGQANRVDLISPPAEAWLTARGVELEDAWSTVLPGDIYAIASHARRTGAGHFDAGPAVTQVGDTVLHAALLEHEPQGPVAVIIEPAVPARRLAPPIVDGYGLSEDEASVLRGVLLGDDSPADEGVLESVVAKVGVAGPGGLVGKVYADHYVPRLTERRPVWSDGWFDDLAILPEPPEPEEPEESEESEASEES